MVISVASGKGGTGKTTVAVNLALSLGAGTQLIDCDVEEPNAHLFIKPVIEHTANFTVPVPQVDMKRCNLCGKCDEICQFKAITVIGKIVMVFDEMCHSCGGCLKVCPTSAITEKWRESGIIQKGYRNGLEFIHGRLNIGEAMSPPLIRKVRYFAHPDKITIIDAPPGTSCPVITSLKNADFVLLVTEPTPFGLYDLKLTVEAVKLLDIPRGLVINRSDIGDSSVLEYAKQENLPVLMEIPFDRQIAEIYSKGDILVEKIPAWREKFYTLYHRINQLIGKNETGGVE